MSVAEDFLSTTGINSYNPSRVRMLEFNVQHGDRIVHLKVSFRTLLAMVYGVVIL